uniref:Fibroblast growth factor n=1 Tax=Mustela putorius furo TaxID=9669 RepID=M3Y567_MUSPF
MSLSFLLLLFLSHLVLSAWARGEKHVAAKGHPGPAATGRSPGGARSSRSGRGTTSSASATCAPHTHTLCAVSGGDQTAPAGKRTGVCAFLRFGINYKIHSFPGNISFLHWISVILGILEIFAVSQGIVGIRGVFSNKFLAMSKKGKLHASAKFTDDCKFRERFQENSYNTYASAIHRTEPAGREWYVALNKRGKAKRGCSPRVKPQHVSTHFLPRFKQLEQPELSFTVTVPEKKKPPGPVKPKVPVSAPRKSPNTVKYRLKFRFG